MTDEGIVTRAWEQPPEADAIYLEFYVERLDARVDFAEFAFDLGQPDEVNLGTHAFPVNGDGPLLARVKTSMAEFDRHTLIWARVLSVDGTSSSWISFDYSHADNKLRGRLFTFLADAMELQGIAGIDCLKHTIIDGGGTFGGPLITVFLTEGTEEYKVYRRIDNGPLTLIEQGLASFSDAVSVAVEDQNLPLNGAKICYFAQLFDEHGNPSPMVRIDCIETRSPGRTAHAHAGRARKRGHRGRPRRRSILVLPTLWRGAIPSLGPDR